MKALILAAGPGTRLGPLTSGVPKCLIDVNGKRILEMQIESILESGINEFIITVGAFSEEVISFVKSRFPGIKADFVHNSHWQETNYIYSMWLAKDLLDDDMLVIHGDLVFEKSLLKRLLESGKKDSILINDEILPGKDFKAVVRNNAVEGIGVDLSGDNAYFCPPIYKLSRPTMALWLREIGTFGSNNMTGVYAEDALNRIMRNLSIEPILYRDSLCMEIDDHDDLEKVRNISSNYI